MTIAEIKKKRVAAEQALAAVRLRAQDVEAREDDALARGDDEYVAWTRQKRLADREVAQLEAAIVELDDEREAEIGRQERDKLQREYEAVKARNKELQGRIVEARKTIIPQLLELIRDLAEDEVAVERINRKIPRGSELWPADSTVRSIPSQAEEIVSDKIVEEWVFENDGHPVPNPGNVVVDASGQGSVSADFGTRRLPCVKRQFRHVTKLAFEPANTAIPLWKSLVLPRFDRIDAPLYDGTRAYSPGHAIELLDAERRGHPRYQTTSVTPVGIGGVATATNDFGPTIPQETA